MAIDNKRVDNSIFYGMKQGQQAKWNLLGGNFNKHHCPGGHGETPTRKKTNGSPANTVMCNLFGKKLQDNRANAKPTKSIQQSGIKKDHSG
jgi:hypothetical protein